MKNLLIVLMINPLLLFSQSVSNYIEVIGVAEKQIEPDRIELTITFNEKENVKKQSDFIKIENQLKNLMSTHSIPESNLIINQLFASSQYYSYSEKQSSKIRFSKVYKLIFDSSTSPDTLIFDLFEIGADNVNLSKLESDQLDNTRQMALKEALETARQKALLISNQMDVDLGTVIQIREISPEYNMRSVDYGRNLSSSFAPESYFSHSGLNWQGLGIEKIELRCVVNVRFQIK